MDTAVSDFAFVAELPKREKSRVGRVIDRINEARALAEEHGFLVPVPLAAEMVSVSRQRIAQLQDDGQLVRVKLGDAVFVPLTSLTDWASSERKSGRPVKISEDSAFTNARRSMKK